MSILATKWEWMNMIIICSRNVDGVSFSPSFFRVQSMFICHRKEKKRASKYHASNNLINLSWCELWAKHGVPATVESIPSAALIPSSPNPASERMPRDIEQQLLFFSPFHCWLKLKQPYCVLRQESHAQDSDAEIMRNLAAWGFALGVICNRNQQLFVSNELYPQDVKVRKRSSALRWRTVSIGRRD